MSNYLIYKTVNQVNGKIYVGQHKRGKKWYLGSGVAFREAIKKYGKENFKRYTIEKLKQVDQNFADERERFWIKELDARNPIIGYNIAEGGLNRRGKYRIKGTWQHSEESLKKIRQAASKRKGKPSWNSGVKYTEEQKKNMKGKAKSEEHKKKLSSRAVTKEWKEKISKARKGQRNNDNRKSIVQLTKQGHFIQNWDCISEAANALKLKVSDIARVCKGINKTCGGYKFQYKTK